MAWDTSHIESHPTPTGERSAMENSFRAVCSVWEESYGLLTA